MSIKDLIKYEKRIKKSKRGELVLSKQESSKYKRLSGKYKNVTLDYFGNQIKTRVDKSTRIAMQLVVRKCVRNAKENAPFKSGRLKKSIRMVEKTSVVDFFRRKKTITWGSFGVPYAIWQEMGTTKMEGKWFLRNAANKFYPSVIKEVAKINVRGPSYGQRLFNQ